MVILSNFSLIRKKEAEDRLRERERALEVAEYLTLFAASANIDFFQEAERGSEEVSSEYLCGAVAADAVCVPAAGPASAVDYEAGISWPKHHPAEDECSSGHQADDFVGSFEDALLSSIQFVWSVHHQSLSV